MWERLKEITAGLFLFAFTGYILCQLVLTKLYEEVIITESNSWILYSELVLSSGILVFSIERLIKALKK